MSNPNPSSLENLCYEINRMAVPARIRAIELILRSLGDSQAGHNSPMPQRGRLSELKGIGKETWSDIDIDQFIREERDSWNS